MKQSLTACALALALTFGVAGCTSEKAPDVTPTPTATATPSTMPETTAPTTTPGTMPETNAPTATPNGAVGSAHRPVVPSGVKHSTAYDNAQYHADGFYHGTDTRDITHDMTNGVKNAVDSTGRAIEDMGNGVRNMAH